VINSRKRRHSQLQEVQIVELTTNGGDDDDNNDVLATAAYPRGINPDLQETLVQRGENLTSVQPEAEIPSQTYVARSPGVDTESAMSISSDDQNGGSDVDEMSSIDQIPQVHDYDREAGDPDWQPPHEDVDHSDAEADRDSDVATDEEEAPDLNGQQRRHRRRGHLGLNGARHRKRRQ
jgi:hypothetical protein